MRKSNAVVLLLVALATVGCTGAARGTLEAEASGAWFSAGWAYDGAGLAQQKGTVTIRLDDRGNAGDIVGTLLDGETAHRVEWTSFRADPEKPFQDGGVAFDLELHGDSGIGDASLPRMHLLAAAWGEAVVLQEGVPRSDSGAGLWDAHLMISDTAARGPDGRILNAARTAPYDPAAPHDAYREKGRLEAWLILRPKGEPDAREPLSVAFSETVSSPSYQNEHPFHVDQLGGSIRLDIRVATAAPATADLRFILVDPDGSEIGAWRTERGSIGSPQNGSIDVAFAHRGNYLLRVEGSALQARYEVEATSDPGVAPHQAPRVVLTFTDVRIR